MKGELYKIVDMIPIWHMVFEIYVIRDCITYTRLEVSEQPLLGCWPQLHCLHLSLKRQKESLGDLSDGANKVSSDVNEANLLNKFLAVF